MATPPQQPPPQPRGSGQPRKPSGWILVTAVAVSLVLAGAILGTAALVGNHSSDPPRSALPESVKINNASPYANRNGQGRGSPGQGQASQAGGQGGGQSGGGQGGGGQASGGAGQGGQGAGQAGQAAAGGQGGGQGGGRGSRGGHGGDQGGWGGQRSRTAGQHSHHWPRGSRSQHGRRPTP
jgi:hypothetical protein